MDLSIITLTYGERSHQLCSAVESILRNTRNIDFEIIVVDNASGEGTRALLGRYACLPNFTWIKLDKNEGVSARNHGFQKATGAYVVVCDDDVVITHSNWFNEMKAYMTEDVWAVGDAGARYNKNGECSIFGSQSHKPGDYVHFLTGYFCMYRNLRKIDGSPKYMFDKNLKSLRDESDLTLQAILDGWKIKQCPKFCVHNSIRKWNPEFDSIDGDNKVFCDKWLPIIESGKIQW